MPKKKPAPSSVAGTYSFATFDNFPNPIWQAGTDAKCNNFNRAWLDFTGRKLEQELGDGWAEGVHPDDLKGCVKDYLAAFKARQPFVLEYRLKHKDGTYHWISDYGSPVHDQAGTFQGYVGSCYDIEQAKRHQSDLENERQKLSTYIEVVDAIILVLGQKGEVKMINDVGCRLLGYDRSEVLGKNWLAAFLPKSEAAQLKKVFFDFMAGPDKSIDRFENAVLTKDGRERLVRWRTFKITESDGSVVSLSSGQDITEEQQAKSHLAHLAELNQKIIDRSPIGIFIVNSQGVIEYVNQAMLDISATPKDKLINFNLIESPAYREAGLDKLIREAIRSKKDFTTDLIRYRSIFGRKETYRIFSGIPILDKAGNFEKLILTIRDETEFKQANEELERFNKLMVGRELKMVELKNELAKLKQKLDAAGADQKDG